MQNPRFIDLAPTFVGAVFVSELARVQPKGQYSGDAVGSERIFSILSRKPPTHFGRDRGLVQEIFCGAARSQGVINSQYLRPSPLCCESCRSAREYSQRNPLNAVGVTGKGIALAPNASNRGQAARTATGSKAGSRNRRLQTQHAATGTAVGLIEGRGKPQRTRTRGTVAHQAGEY